MVTAVAKPSVLVDGTAFEGTGRIGIWRLFFETISRTSRDIDYTILLDGTAVLPLPQGIVVHQFQRAPELISRRHILWKSVRRFHQSSLRSLFPDHIWHPTFYSLDPRGVSFGKGPMRVVTVYDMLAEEFYWMGDFTLQRQIKKNCLVETDHVVTISSETAQSLKRYFPELNDRTTVISLAADHTLQREDEAQQIQELETKINGRTFCLFVGGRNLYKHFEFVVRAMSSTGWPEELNLLVVGTPFEDAERAFIQSYNVQHRILHVGAVKDQLLNWLYQQAVCFIFPSLGEGFGLPVLESQLNGTIPVLSDIAVFREVGGAGALYYSPHNIFDFIGAVRVTLNPLERAHLLMAGRTNAEKFSWDTTATQMVAFYEAIERGSRSRSGT